MSLPAVTLLACRTRVKVMNAVTVESRSPFFVFHLVEHLGVSMVAHKSEQNFGRLQVMIKRRPSTIPNV